MKVSVIATVLNEGDNIHQLLRSLTQQTRPADEIIIVDGGSRDNTVDVLRLYQVSLPLTILSRPGCNISAGRNAAIESATGDIIMATDAGLHLAPCWIECLEAPFLHDPSVQLVGGVFEAAAQTLFELAMGACVSRLPDEIDAKTFLPGSRSIAYRKALWEQVGRYPEWLDFGEDMVFILRARAAAGGLIVAPDAIVYFRPRSSLRAFYKQYYHYARGDGKADLWRKRHAIRYATYFVILPAIFVLGLMIHPLLWLLYGVGGALYLRQPYRRLRVALRSWPDRSPLTTLRAWALIPVIPVIRVTGDVAKMIGYPAGVWWRFNQALTPGPSPTA